MSARVDRHRGKPDAFELRSGPRSGDRATPSTAGVTRQMVTGTDLASSRAAAALAARHPRMLWSTAGVHPHHAACVRAGAGCAARGAPGAARGGGGRRMRARLFSRFLAAPGAAGRLRRAARDRRPHRQARVPASARRARGLHGHTHRAPRGAARRGRALLHRRPASSSRPISLSACRSASPAGSATSAAAAPCGRPCRAFRAGRLLLETDAPYLLPRDLDAAAEVAP